MKSILLLTIALITFATANAQTNSTTEPAKTTTETVKTETAKDGKSTTTPSTNNATAKYDDDSSQFVGTNDFYLLLVKEGVKKG